MRRWMLAGNWKMHNTIEESRALARAIVEGAERCQGRGDRGGARLHGPCCRL